MQYVLSEHVNKGATLGSASNGKSHFIIIIEKNEGEMIDIYNERAFFLSQQVAVASH